MYDFRNIWAEELDKAWDGDHAKDSMPDWVHPIIDRAAVASMGRVAVLEGATVLDQWRCFHCSEVFTDRDAAADHFGWNEYGSAACRVDGALAHAYRVQENELRRSREEDTDLHRSMWSMGAKAERDRREWGDKEYAKGLADGRGLRFWYRGRPWQWHIFNPLQGQGYRAFWFGPFKIVVRN